MIVIIISTTNWLKSLIFNGLIIDFFSIFLFLLDLFLFLDFIWGVLINILFLITIVILLSFNNLRRLVIYCWNCITDNICWFCFFIWSSIIVEDELISILYFANFYLFNLFWSTIFIITLFSTALLIRGDIFSTKFL